MHIRSQLVSFMYLQYVRMYLCMMCTFEKASLVCIHWYAHEHVNTAQVCKRIYGVWHVLFCRLSDVPE